MSGTPPAELLFSAPVTYDQGWDLAKVYEPSRDSWEVKAFHWGSLTSKSSLTAFWILLAPFAMANVAGWMSESPNVWSRIWIRVAGLSLTGILFAQLSNVFLDIPYSAGVSQSAIFWMFMGLSVVLVVGLGLLSTQSTFRPLRLGERLRYLFVPSVDAMNPPLKTSDWDDPAGDASLVGVSMWGVHSILHRLRRLHLVFGMATLSLVAARAVELDTLGVAAIALAGVTMVTVAFTTGTSAGNTLVLAATAWLPVAGIALLVWALGTLASGNIASLTLNVSDDITYEIALILGAAAAFGLLGELATSRGRRGWVPLGLLAIATLVGGTYGLTGAMLADTFFSDPPSTQNAFDGGAEFVTVGMLGLVVVIGVMLILAMFTAGDETDESRLRRGILRARTVLGVAGGYGAIVGAAAVALSCRGSLEGCTQANITLPEWVVEDEDSLAVLFGLPFDPASVLGWAKLLMVAVPAVLIVRSIVGGLLNGQDSRRQVGILWDLGSFWPRWFHPLGPPAYGPYAVNRLQTIISNNRPDVLSAHSQGSLVSAVALSLTEDDERPGLFITYGSQIGELYPSLFPGVGFQALMESTDRQVDGRWINLWRPSDPIGGQVVTGIGDRNWVVKTGRGHSRYELTPEFCAAREKVGKGGLDRPTDQEMSECWDRNQPIRDQRPL